MKDKMCPKCGKYSLKVGLTQYGEEMLEEEFCECGYYNNQIISLTDLEIPVPMDVLPDNFKF